MMLDAIKNILYDIATACWLMPGLFLTVAISLLMIPIQHSSKTYVILSGIFWIITIILSNNWILLNVIILMTLLFWKKDYQSPAI